MSENNDYIQLPPLKKDTPADVAMVLLIVMPKTNAMIAITI